MTILITGGCGFIGSNFVRLWLAVSDEKIVNIDKVTYAALPELATDDFGGDRYHFIRGDIADAALIASIMEETKPRAVINFAAESHVDRSIEDGGVFLQSNVVGVFNLLNVVKSHWERLPNCEARNFRFLQVSTDEVFGSLSLDAPAFTEDNSYLPNSPYSASKASADHFVRAFGETYGLPTIITHCSNNYGPWQNEEKFIPKVIKCAVKNETIPVYGDGTNIRDWIFVNDHCDALIQILEKAKPFQCFNIGGECERTNLEIVDEICRLLDIWMPMNGGNTHSSLVKFVSDRPGHDFRYAINNRKMANDLKWYPTTSFSDGIELTVRWYLLERR